jgi:hypothetical protein
MIAQTFGTQAVHELSPIAPETIFAITTRCARVFSLSWARQTRKREAMLPIIMPGIAWTKTRWLTA